VYISVKRAFFSDSYESAADMASQGIKQKRFEASTKTSRVIHHRK